MRSAMTIGVIATVCSIVVMSVAAQAQSLNQTLDYYHDVTETVLNNGRRLILPVLTDEQHAVEREIRVRVSPTGDIDAFARRGTNRRREILISSGLTEVLEWIATSVVLDESGHKGCLVAYLPYLLNGIVNNSKAVAAGGIPAAVYTPFAFGSQTRNPCSSASLAQFTGDKGTAFAKMMDASIFFFYLHELGHHVLGHVDSGDVPLADKRTQEAKADAWAIDTAFKANFDLTVGSPALLLMAGIGGDSLESERKSDHPLGIRRAYEMLREARRILASQHSASVSEVDAIVDRLARLVPMP